jgi:flagellar biogenesis protein FliO
MNGSTIMTLLQTIVVLLAVIALANMSLKLLNKKLQGGGKTMEIIERTQVTNTSSLAIVKVLEDYYLMSLSDGGNQILKKLPRDEVEIKLQEASESTTPASLQDMLQTLKEMRGKGE